MATPLNTSLDASSKNPWDALFVSTTRPRSHPTNKIPSTNDIGTHPNVDNRNDASSSPSAMAGGYTILIQHSITSQSQRDYAFSSAVNESSVPHSHSVTRSMGSLSVSRPSQSSPRASGAQPSACGEWFGITGSFLARKAFDELCCRCDGSVVFVTLLGNAGIVDVESLNGFNDHVYNGSDDDDDGHDHGVRKREQKKISRRKQALKLFRRFGAIVDLASNPFGWAEEPMDVSSHGFVTKSTMNSLQSIANVIRTAAVRVESHRETPQSPSSQKQYGQQPIPIMFDSLTPLLSLHGVHNVILLLHSFKQVIASRPLTLSPIVVPILYESMRPSDHRLLEDMADSLLSLQLMEIKHQNSEIASGVLDVVRRGGGGNGLGGKLMRDCIPVHIMTAIKYPTSINGRNFDARDRFYWILDYRDDSSQKKQLPNENSDTTKTNSDREVKRSAENAQLKPRPRIYLEDDDPEFDDLDEEDPDEDLDL